MKHFKQFLTEEISVETQKITELLVDNVYSESALLHQQSYP